jgi:hypothetical protein
VARAAGYQPTYISDEQMLEVRRLWAAGADRATVVAAAGCSAFRLFDRNLENRPGRGSVAHPSLRDDPLPRRQGRGGGRRRGAAFHCAADPTPPEIEAACVVIQRGWSHDERQARRYQGAPDLCSWKTSGREVDAAVRRDRHPGERNHDSRCRPF